MKMIIEEDVIQMMMDYWSQHWQSWIDDDIVVDSVEDDQDGHFEMGTIEIYYSYFLYHLPISML